MPNILQLQKELESLPDERLIQEVNSPSMYPSYLSTQEAQRREQLRNAYKSRVSQMPQNTVKDQLVQRLMSGIGSIPQNVPNGPMPNEMMTQMQAPMQPPMGMYAGGGIVGYKTGGEVDPDPKDKDPELIWEPGYEYPSGELGLDYGLMGMAVPSIKRGFANLTGFGHRLGTLLYGPSIYAGRDPRRYGWSGRKRLAPQEEIINEEVALIPTLDVTETNAVQEDSPRGQPDFVNTLLSRYMQDLDKRGKLTPEQEAYLEMLTSTGDELTQANERYDALQRQMIENRRAAELARQARYDEREREMGSQIDPDADRRAMLAMALSGVGQLIATGWPEEIGSITPSVMEYRAGREERNRQILERIQDVRDARLASQEEMQNFIDELELKIAQGAITRQEALREIALKAQEIRATASAAQPDYGAGASLMNALANIRAAQGSSRGLTENALLGARQKAYESIDSVINAGVGQPDKIGPALLSIIALYQDTISPKEMMDAISRALEASSFDEQERFDVKKYMEEQLIQGLANGGLVNAGFANLIPQP